MGNADLDDNVHYISGADMLIRLILISGFATLCSCTMARMAVDPKLNTNFDEYKITEKPGLFSGDKMKFGPYLATKVDHDWATGSSITISPYKNEEESQRYTYQFTGKRSWKGECKRRGKSQTLGKVSFGIEEGLNCMFITTAEKGLPESKFEFSFKGPSLVDAEGVFKAEKENIRVVAISKLQGYSLKLGTPSGYYFYSGKKLIAAVDNISSKGPVWLSHNLSLDEKDRVSLVITALLLIQEK